MRTGIESNITKIYAFRYFWMSLIIIPVVVPFFHSHGLNMHQVFLLQVIFAAVVTILEVPSGYLSDLWGRKNTMLVGSFSSGLAYIVLYNADGFWSLALFELLQAIGLSLVSGTDLAIVYDSMKEKDHASMGVKVVANFQFFSSGAEAVASVAGGLLAAYSFKHVVATQLFFGWMPFLIALTLVEPQFEKMKRSEALKNFKEILAHIFRGEALLRLAFVNFVFWSLSTFMAVWVLQKHWENEGILLSYFGFIWATYNLTTAIASKLTHRFEKWMGRRFLLSMMALAPVFGYLSMTFMSVWWAIVLGLGFSVSRGVKFVILKDIINNRVPSRFRATANSLANLCFRGVFCILGPALGFSIDRFGIPMSMLVTGLLFGFVGIFVLGPLLRALKEDT